jgi:hypothetical protein
LAGAVAFALYLSTLEIAMNSKDVLDLIDEANWEDSDKVEKLTLEEAGLEERNPNDDAFLSGIHAYINWFYDGMQSEFDV